MFNKVKKKLLKKLIVKKKCFNPIEMDRADVLVINESCFVKDILSICGEVDPFFHLTTISKNELNKIEKKYDVVLIISEAPSSILKSLRQKVDLKHTFITLISSTLPKDQDVFDIIWTKPNPTVKKSSKTFFIDDATHPPFLMNDQSNLEELRKGFYKLIEQKSLFTTNLLETRYRFCTGRNSFHNGNFRTLDSQNIKIGSFCSFGKNELHHFCALAV